jgi:hypothetical protein
LEPTKGNGKAAEEWSAFSPSEFFFRIEAGPMYSGMVWSGVYRVMLMVTYPHSSAAQVPGDGQLALRVQTDLKLIIR